MQPPRTAEDLKPSGDDSAAERRNATFCAQRLLRPPAAHAYLAMNKNQFNSLVRPDVIVFHLGKRAIAFDRLELDVWAEDYCRRNGRSSPQQEDQQCRSMYPASSRGRKPAAALNGTSINGSKIMDDFVRALAR